MELTKIAPKLAAEMDTVPPALQQYMGTMAEFPLRSYDSIDDAAWRHVVEVHNLREVVLHAPFRQHLLEDACLSASLRPVVEAYFLRQCEFADSAGVDIRILFHTCATVESALNLNLYAALNDLLHTLDSCPRVSLLVENTIVGLDLGRKRIEEDPITEILLRTPANKVGMCFDLCHYLASKNAVHDEYVFSPTWLSRIYSVHFSETRNNEGYIHYAETHGCPHTSKHGVARDLCILKDLGIDLSRVYIVTEITERDYSTREAEAQELAWLHALNKEGIEF